MEEHGIARLLYGALLHSTDTSSTISLVTDTGSPREQGTHPLIS